MNLEDLVIGKCALCDTENTVLRVSHIIPKFVSDWVKSTSKTGYLRSSDDVNKRYQDGQKKSLLCDKCEGELSSMEKDLAEGFFKKIANYRNQKSEITITESMYCGVLSIFWRALVTSKSRDNNRTSEDTVELEKFIVAIKSQVLSRQCDTKIYCAPFFGNPPYYSFTKEMTYNLERSFGNQDIRFFDNPHRFFATFKIPFAYFYVFSGGWDVNDIGTAMEFTAGDIRIDEIKDIPEVLTDYIFWVHDQFMKSRSRMNDENLKKIQLDSAKNKNITGSDKSTKRSAM